MEVTKFKATQEPIKALYGKRMLPTKPRGVPQPSVSGYVLIKSTP